MMFENIVIFKKWILCWDVDSILKVLGSESQRRFL